MPKLLTKLFYSCQKINDSHFLKYRGKDGKMDQELVLKLTFKHPCLSRLLPCNKYCQSFLKKIIVILEEGKEEVIEEVYNRYLALLSGGGGGGGDVGIGGGGGDNDEGSNDDCLDGDSGEYIYKAYFIKDIRSGRKELKKSYKDDDGIGDDDNDVEEEEEDGSWVRVMESSNMMSLGTTGLSVWQASFFMIEWLAQQEEVFLDKDIVELGAGTGLLGLAVSALQSHQHSKKQRSYNNNPATKCISQHHTDHHHPTYTFSDHHPHVLNILKRNVRLNKTLSTSLRVERLSWHEALPPLPSFQLIIASDVVFDVGVVPHLVNTLKTLLSTTSPITSTTFSSTTPPITPKKSPITTPTHKEAYICSVIRNNNTWQSFVDTCEEEGLEVCHISFNLSTCRVFDFLNYQTPFRIIKITL